VRRLYDEERPAGMNLFGVQRVQQLVAKVTLVAGDYRHQVVVAAV
jgi:hypothetical protein